MSVYRYRKYSNMEWVPKVVPNEKKLQYFYEWRDKYVVYLVPFITQDQYDRIMNINSYDDMADWFEYEYLIYTRYILDNEFTMKIKIKNDGYISSFYKGQKNDIMQSQRFCDIVDVLYYTAILHYKCNPSYIGKEFLHNTLVHCENTKYNHECLIAFIQVVEKIKIPKEIFVYILKYYL